jgi:hypothetical protein
MSKSEEIRTDDPVGELAELLQGIPNSEYFYSGVTGPEICQYS